ENQGRDYEKIPTIGVDDANGFPFFSKVKQVVHLDRGAIDDGVLRGGEPGILLGSLPDFVPDNLRINKDCRAFGNGSRVEKTPYQSQPQKGWNQEQSGYGKQYF